MTTLTVSRGGVVTPWITLRYLRAMVRQPWYLFFTIVQPVVWLLLFGKLFQNVVKLPGFGGSHSYIAYLTPGVVAMTSLFSNGWAGMAFIDDMERGVLDRFLVSPARRSSLIVGQLAYQAVSTVIQSLIIVGLALAAGARFPGGAGGGVLLVLGAVLLGWAFAGYSHWMALSVRQRESLIGAVNFLVLPLSFLSTGFLPAAVMPSWIRHIATYNPVDWAVELGRQLLRPSIDWSVVGSRGGGLVALAIACTMLASVGFGSYRKSV